MIVQVLHGLVWARDDPFLQGVLPGTGQTGTRSGTREGAAGQQQLPRREANSPRALYQTN